jgi:uncharacterized membrane protein
VYQVVQNRPPFPIHTKDVIMRLSVSRTIDAPIDTVWALQIDHEHWPAHLPNFKEVVRHDAGRPFGPQSSAAITQPGLGTVVWTVTEYDDAPGRKAYAWSGRARGATYVGRHEVEAAVGDQSVLTLTIEVSGGLTPVMAPLMRRSMQKAVAAEMAAFAAWARSVAAV